MCIKEILIYTYMQNSLDVVNQDAHCYSQVAEVPFNKSDIFVQYLQDNIPPGVTVHMELKKWEDFVSPPDPRLLEQERLEREKIEAWKNKNQSK